MTDEKPNNFDLPRRTVLRGTAGLGVLGLASGPAAGRGNPGGRPPSSPPPGGSGGGGGGTATVTLITGETVHVTGDGDRRQYTLPEEDAGAYQIYDVEDGTYVVPDGVNFDLFSRELFDVEFLIEQGMTDEETDSIPVIVELAADVDARADASAMSTGGFTATRFLESIDSVAGEVPKERDRMATAQDTFSSPVVDRIYLDAKHEALLDTSADAVNATAAREQYGVDGSGTSIAILDTGIDADHPDFGDRIVHQRDFSGDGVEDANGHGTHCAGIAAGAGAENGDYVGMAPGADLWNVKVLDDTGSGSTSNIVAGIEHAVDRGADVISMSLGGPTQENGPMVQAIEATVDAGVTAAVAAGNDWDYQTIGSPGIAESALTVGASDESGGITYFSSGGPTPYDYLVKPEVVAPGSGITSTGSEAAGEYPYTGKNGTSMSTPHVAGIAALLLEHDPDRSPADVKDALVSTADRLDGPDVYKQGGGVVDAEAALGADLRVHDAVRNFGLFDTPTTETATVELENTGSEALDVDVTASLTNVQSDESLPDGVDVSPSSVTVAAGATETVEFTVDAGDAFGFNSGVLTFETADESHHAIFGYVRGIEVTVEKIPHENSAGVANEDLYAYAHDGSFSHLGFSAFDADGEYSFVVFDDGGQFTLWSSGQLASPEGRAEGDPTWTIGSAEISVDDSHVTLDERDVVARELDTSRVAEHEPLQMRRFDANLYMNIEDGMTALAGRGFTGDFGIRDVHVTPVAEDDPTNVGTAYQMFTENPDAEYTFDSDNVYQLFYGTLSFDGPHQVVVDPAELAEENLEYHRTYEGQLFAIGATMWPDDFEHFPTSVTTSFLADVSDERVEQTWYRNEQAVYDETWYDGGGFSGDYMLDRAEWLNPEAGATYDQPINAEPLGNGIPTWELDDGTLTVHGQWYTDNAEVPFVAYQYAHSSHNEYAISVDGEVVQSETTYYTLFGEFQDPTVEVPDVSPGSTVELSLDGNVLAVTSRDTTTSTDYRVTYQPGTANTPPQIDALDVTSLSHYNEVPAGPTVAFVEVAHESAGVDDLAVYYAATGSVSGSPFDGASGWQRAEVVYSDGDTYGVLLDTAGYTGGLEVAATATDAAGNSVETTTFDALRVAGGADASVPVEVHKNHLNLGSNQKVKVTIPADSGIDTGDIDVDSLRFGNPAGDRAAPVKAKRKGQGDLMAWFRAADAGYACTDGPVAAQLTGRLTDGTTISGVDVVPRVTCDE